MLFTNIRECARCGLDHDHLLIQERPEREAVEDDFRHYAICPTTQKRILLKVTFEGALR